MHILGLQGQPRRMQNYTTYRAGQRFFNWIFWNRVATVGSYILAIGVFLFLVNVIVTARKGAKAPLDPWDARSLEWMTASPPKEHNFDSIPTVHALDEFFHRKYEVDHDSGKIRKVATGEEVLAELETPETDELLSQALATRQQTMASLELAKSTEARWIALRAKDAVSQQEVDEKRSNSTQAQANLAAAEANMQRLKQLSNFKSLLSPTDGVITRRNVDTGDLVDAGAVGGLPRALFVVTQTDPLRLFVNVPQTYAQQIKPGQTVIVRQTELQGQKFEGKLARTGASIDPLTRSMQVEISLPNKSGVLLPGAFVQVDLPLQTKATLTIPNNALIIRAGAIKVAVVDAEKRVRMQVVTLGRNLGEQVEVMSGLKDGARLVLNPPDALSDGDQVNFAIDAPKEEGGAKEGSTKDTPPSEKAKP
jgi:RND family efflux transporter MFP subunit